MPKGTMLTKDTGSYAYPQALRPHKKGSPLTATNSPKFIIANPASVGFHL